MIESDVILYLLVVYSMGIKYGYYIMRVLHKGQAPTDSCESRLAYS